MQHDFLFDDDLPYLSRKTATRLGLPAVLLCAVLLGLGLFAFRPAGASVAGAAPAAPVVGINGAACAYNDILSAIAAASSGDTIYISPGTYNGPLGTIDMDLSFVGATTDCTAEEPANAPFHYTLDGSGIFSPNGGIVNIAPGRTVNFTRILFTNGFADYGGNVYVGEGARANFYLTRIEYGEANLDGGNVYVAQDAIFVSEWTSFVNNGLAGNNGGGIFAAGRVELLNADVVANDATRGGGVALSGTGSLYADGSDIGNGPGSNVAQIGGGVHMTGQSTLVLGCNARVTANFALAGNGGGIYAEGETLIDLTCNSMVRGNSAAAGFGGGIYAANNAVITMRDESLVGTAENPAWFNEAIRGGGLYLDGARAFTMYDEAQVLYNQAGDHGGGVYLIGGSRMIMNGGIVGYNVTGVNGGGIALSDGYVELNDGAVIRGNQAMFGGGVAQWNAFGNEFKATNAIIDKNEATVDGGGIYVLIGDVLLADSDGTSQLVNNQAQQDGGGIFVHGSVDLVVQAEDTASRLRAESNRAGRNGGFAYVQNGDVQIAGRVTVAGNVAHDSGGGLYQDGGTLDIRAEPQDHTDDRRVTFRGNDAQLGSGGGLYLNAVSGGAGDPNSLLYSMLIEGNEAAVRGGGLYLSSGTYLYLLNVRVLSNAADEGAGMVVDNARIAVRRLPVGCVHPLMPADEYCSEFRGNTATGSAGAIGVDNGGELVLEHTAVLDNKAVQGSAVLSAGNGDKIEITNSLISGNQGKAVYIGAAAQVEVINATIAGNDWAVDVDVPGGALEMSNTIVWDNGFGVESAVAVTGGCSISQNGVGGAMSDPLFQTTARGDYRLQALSPAVDACAAGTSVDLDELPRPQGANYDMGAFEAGPPLILFALTLNIAEGDAGISEGVLQITLSEASSMVVEVTVDAAGLSATEGVDFQPLSKKITFEPGVTSRNVKVKVIGDLLVEGDEELELLFSNAQNGVLVVSSVLVTIVDDDAPLHQMLYIPLILNN